MARRLALLALLFAAALLPLRASTHHSSLASSSSENSESFDPFVLIDDYEDSLEPIPLKSRSSAKVILRTKPPKVNVSVIKSKNNIVKFNDIKFTKLEATQKPPKKTVSSKPWRVKHHSRPLVEVSPQFVLLESSMRLPNSEVTTEKPPPPVARRPTTTRAPPTTRRPPTTSRKPQRTTKSTTKSKVGKKTTKVPKTTPCPPKGWLSSYFQEKIKVQKVPKPAPTKPSWLTGILSSVYNWIWGPEEEESSGSWFSGGSWFAEEKKTSTTTTTTEAPVTTTANWFTNLLNSEEDDGAYAMNTTQQARKKSSRKTYKGYQLLRAYPDLQWKVHELIDLQEETEDTAMKWWTAPSINGSTDILVPPDLLADIKDHLKSLKIDFDVVIWDLQKAITYENPRLSKKQRIELEQLRGHPLTWRRYHRYADMLRYLEYLQHSYADIVELIPLGRSSEGLPLVAVKVALPKNESSIKGSDKGSKKKWKLKSRLKPAVWIDGGAHAREWIAPAVTTWILHTLVEGEKGFRSEQEVLQQADFYIMPLVNPDGYEHSHTHDRLWRKTRSRHSEQSEDFIASWLPWNWGRSDCVGVDTDRNWDYHWGEKDASKDPCSDNYAGPHPFSEPETRAVSTFLNEHKDQIKVYLSLHAYSQSWLVPSSHAHAPFSDDGVLMEMGKLATAALADVYGTKYQIGTAAELRQPASGMSMDWAKARAGIKFSYHIDLRDSFGPYGFLLPGSQIVPTGRETWQAIKAIVDNL